MPYVGLLGALQVQRLKRFTRYGHYAGECEVIITARLVMVS